MLLPFSLLSLSLLACDHLVGAHTPQEPLAFDVNAPLRHAHRIAIIGAGAGGSSAAYHLHKFAKDSYFDAPLLNITIFETNSRVGGRTTTANAWDDAYYPIELGASIFVKVNQILYNATKEFGLNVKSNVFGSRSDSDFDLGVWDGRGFVFKQGSGNSRWQGWWDIAKLLWQYGLSPIRTQRLTTKVVGQFLQFYEHPIFPFTSLSEAVDATALGGVLAVTGNDVLREASISGQFANDIIQASTRVNYAQNLDEIHGLETMVCMATDGAMQVEGGNWQIFDEAVKRSRARVFLNTAVTEVKKDDQANYHLTVDDPAVSSSELEFDNVILAAPYQFTNITFSPPPTILPTPIPYVKLHVTLFATPHLISPSFFNIPLTSQKLVPNTILTTLPYTSLESSSSEPHQFYSISTLKQTTHNGIPNYIYKIFSPAPLTATFLATLFPIPHTKTSPSDPISAIPSSHITWLNEKVWDSYPYEKPRTEFEAIRLDGKENSGKGVWYTSGIESFISTMETSALMGMNVARLVLDELLYMEVTERFDRGIPNPRKEEWCGTDLFEAEMARMRFWRRWWFNYWEAAHYW